MGFTEVLTLIFITLKLTGNIDWSWWAVLSPTIVSIVLIILFLSVACFITGDSPSFYLRKKKK